MGDSAKSYIEAALGSGGQTATPGEPINAMTDEVIRQQIIEGSKIYSYVYEGEGDKRKIAVDEEGNPKIVQIGKYDDIENWIMNTGPQDSLTFFDKNQASAYWFRTKHELRKAKCRHRQNHNVVDLLNKIELRKYVMTFGDAEGGMKQTFVARLMGGIREVTVNRGEKKGLFGR